MHFHFRHGPGQFDAGRAAAHDDEIEQGLQFMGGSLYRILKGFQDAVAQGHRIGNGFHRKRMGLDPAVAKKVGGAAKGDDKPVIVKIAYAGVNDLFIGVDPLHFGDMDFHIFCVLKYFPQRKGDAGRFEPCRGNLVHERLELVVIVAIDEKYVIIRVV